MAGRGRAHAPNPQPKRVHARPGEPDGHEEYTSLWELGGLYEEAQAKDWLPNAKSLATTSSS